MTEQGILQLPFVMCRFALVQLKKNLFYTIKNYLIFFTVNEGEKIVNVIRFLYGRRDWKNILKNNV
jgi:hypothetical protein